jgi:hypothetical protein
MSQSTAWRSSKNSKKMEMEIKTSEWYSSTFSKIKARKAKIFLHLTSSNPSIKNTIENIPEHLI